MGAPVLDTDDTARQLLLDPVLLATVRTRFPECAAPGEALNRRLLRQTIATDHAARRWLEQLLHPRIWHVVDSWLAAQNTAYAIVSVPLLLESGWAPRFDTVVMIRASDPVRLQRIRQRDGLSLVHAEQLLAAQSPNSAVRAIADIILDNDSSPQALQQLIREADSKLRTPFPLPAQ